MERKDRKAAWLDINFGCCASKEDVDVDEGREALRAAGEAEMRICYSQPQLVPQPRAEPQHPRPSTSHSMSRHVSQWVSTSRDFATRASSRASISTLTRPRRSHSRPSIGRPTDFRHFGGVDGLNSMVDSTSMPLHRRGGFRPLELSIYLPDGCGRLSPLPDFEDEESWGAQPAGLEKPAQALVRERDSRTNSVSSNPSSTNFLIQRKAVGSGSRRSSVHSATTSMQERRLSGTTLATMATPTLPFLFEDTPASPDNSMERTPLRRSRTSGSGTFSPVRVLSRLPSPSRSRSNTAPSRPGSLRRARTDVEDAIRELNTIVEERRASAYRSQTQSPTPTNPSLAHHVPCIAPSMRMNVRSETLSDIGSAFSAPVAFNPSPAPTRKTSLTLSPPSRRYTGPLNSNPITPPPPQTPTTPISRLGAWIRRSKSSLTSQPTTPQTAEPFYQCEPPLPYQPATPSRPSTAGSRTITHVRQDSSDSNATATVTLFSASSATTSRSPSPDAKVHASSPPRKRRVPSPLNLAKEKEMAVEVALASARSTRSYMNAKPPMSPHFDLLKGMEISARDVGARTSVGVAF